MQVHVAAMRLHVLMGHHGEHQQCATLWLHNVDCLYAAVTWQHKLRATCQHKHLVVIRLDSCHATHMTAGNAQGAEHVQLNLPFKLAGVQKTGGQDKHQKFPGAGLRHNLPRQRILNLMNDLVECTAGEQYRGTLISAPRPPSADVHCIDMLDASAPLCSPRSALLLQSVNVLICRKKIQRRTWTPEAAARQQMIAGLSKKKTTCLMERGP